MKQTLKNALRQVALGCAVLVESFTDLLFRQRAWVPVRISVGVLSLFGMVGLWGFSVATSDALIHENVLLSLPSLSLQSLSSLSDSRFTLTPPLEPLTASDPEHAFYSEPNPDPVHSESAPQPVGLHKPRGQGLAFSPVSGRLSSWFGWRVDPVHGHRRFHQGIDIAAPTGSVVYAPQPGRVVYSGVYQGYGNLVVIAHSPDLQTWYGHNARNAVSAGQWVTAGTPIAQVGSTGRSTGPHLHFEVRQNQSLVNPLEYLAYLNGYPTRSLEPAKLPRDAIEIASAAIKNQVKNPVSTVISPTARFPQRQLHSQKPHSTPLQNNSSHQTLAQEPTAIGGPDFDLQRSVTNRPEHQGKTMEVIRGGEISLVQF